MGSKVCSLVHGPQPFPLLRFQGQLSPDVGGNEWRGRHLYFTHATTSQVCQFSGSPALRVCFPVYPTTGSVLVCFLGTVWDRLSQMRRSSPLRDRASLLACEAMFRIWQMIQSCLFCWISYHHIEKKWQNQREKLAPSKGTQIFLLYLFQTEWLWFLS